MLADLHSQQIFSMTAVFKRSDHLGCDCISIFLRPLVDMKSGVLLQSRSFRKTSRLLLLYLLTVYWQSCWTHDTLSCDWFLLISAFSCFNTTVVSHCDLYMLQTLQVLFPLRREKQSFSTPSAKQSTHIGGCTKIVQIKQVLFIAS